MNNKVFGNEISEKVVKKALKKQQSYIKKFGDDRDKDYKLKVQDIESLNNINLKNIVISDEGKDIDKEKAVIIGNIRMGFGHYRIAMAIASAANSMGYTPYWFDLLSFKEANSGKIISHLNDLYSLGSRLSQKSKLFNKFYWEKVTTDGFKSIEYNYTDQKMTELMTGVYNNLDKDIPYIATHVWNAQTAIHSGMKKVINVIPDNFPLGLHLAEGSIHTLQTPSSYMGYRALIDMSKKTRLKEIPSSDIKYTGHYVDHELVENIEIDCEARLKRIRNGENRRVLISIGGAGAQQELVENLIRYMLKDIKNEKVALFINVGDHKNVWENIAKNIKGIEVLAKKYFNKYDELQELSDKLKTEEAKGLYVIYNENIFEAVYATNILMRDADIFITKPSELSFYPVPKLLIERVGGHEAWGAIRSSEVGDGTIECRNLDQTLQFLELMLKENDLLELMCDAIVKNKKIGIYNGAYEVVKLAVGEK
jgi:UDP-N-acetylglucosamine:LPS N-acetylglucosamine transferase